MSEYASRLMKSDATETSSPTFLLVGDGRLAHHLQFYFRELGLSVLTWSRRQNSPEQWAEALDKSSHILLAVKDDAIAEIAQRLLGTSPTVVHFSGAKNIPGVFAAHPLMTFGQELQSLSWYKQIPFVVDAGVKLEQMLPGLPNHYWEVDPQYRPLYHALCSLAGNSTYLLWRRIGDELEQQLRLPRQILQPFLIQTAINSLQPQGGDFTGPLARGDWQVIDQHLTALKSRPELEQAYRSYLNFAERTLKTEARAEAIPKELL